MGSDERIDTQTLGIHHVTAIAGDPQKNLDFYKLPPWLEGTRNELERVLPPLRRPAPRGAAEGESRG